MDLTTEFDLVTFLVGFALGAAAFWLLARSWLLVACLAISFPVTIVICEASGIPTGIEQLSAWSLGLGAAMGLSLTTTAVMLRRLSAPDDAKAERAEQ